MFERDGFLTGVSLASVPADSASSYPFTLPAVRTLDALELHPAVNFFVGENGSGKSTVLEAIAVSMGFNAEGGSRNFRFTTRSSESSLGDVIRPHRTLKRPRTGYFLRAESFFNVATEIERIDAASTRGAPIRDSYGPRALHEQSHGESFWSLFMHRFGEDGLYLLDEPEAALSPARQMAFLVRMHELVQQRCQFIIATHAPILLTYPNARVWSFTDDGIAQISYRDTDHFLLTRRILEDPEAMMKQLLDPDPGESE